MCFTVFAVVGVVVDDISRFGSVPRNRFSPLCTFAVQPDLYCHHPRSWYPCVRRCPCTKAGLLVEYSSPRRRNSGRCRRRRETGKYSTKASRACRCGTRPLDWRENGASYSKVPPVYRRRGRCRLLEPP